MQEITNQWSLDQITIKLKLIASIESGSKLNISDYSIVSKDSIWGSLWRTFKREDFNKTISFFNVVYKNTLETLEKLEKSDHDKILNLICDAFKSFEGLTNIKSTYKDNNFFICSIDALIQSTVISLRAYIQKNKMGEEYMNVLEDHDTFRNIVVFPYKNDVKENKTDSSIQTE